MYLGKRIVCILLTTLLVASIQGVEFMQGVVHSSFQDVERIYDAVAKHKLLGHTFALEIEKKKRGGHMLWRIVGVQPYRALDCQPEDVFCNIINKKGKARMIFADDKHIGIFPLRNSSSKYTHVMVIPREHSGGVTDISKQELKAVLQKSAEIAARLGTADNYRLWINNGAPLQTVPHLHVHVFAYHKKRSYTLFDLVSRKIWQGNTFNDIEALVQKAHEK